MNTLRFFTSALLLAWGYPAPPAVQAATFPAGVYSLSAADQPAPSQVYDNPFVDGIAVRTLWKTLEPAEGQYDWSFLDSEIQKAASTGKKISLSIAASRGAPDWVYAAGAQPYQFIDQNPNHPTFGQVLTMPIPWDSVFLAKWTAFIRTLGSRYAGDPTLAYIQGATASVTNGWGLPEVDATGQSWVKYGYTPEKLLAAMTTVLDTFMSAFPSTHHWGAVGTIKFEPQVSGQSPTYVAEQIAAYGFQTYPDRFGVWREDLSGCIPNPPTGGQWKILWDHKGRNGAQMLWNVQDGPTRMNPCGITPNDKPTVLKEALSTAMDYGMSYVEIYQIDVLDPALAPVIQFAAENLATLSLRINGDPAATVTTTNPVIVTYTIRGGQGRELFLVLDAPAMHIPLSYYNAAGQWVPLPANLGDITPFGAAPADGDYTLYTGVVPAGTYSLCLGYDTIPNGRLDLPSTVYDCAKAIVQ